MSGIPLRIFVTTQAWIAARLDGERGQTLAEYGMIVAVIAVIAVAGAGVLFRDQIAGAFTSAGDCMNHAVANSAC